MTHPELAPVPDEARPAASCLGCHHRPPANGYLCGRCERALDELLDTIRTGYPRLDPTPHGSGAGLDGAQHSAAPPGPRPAARVDVLALTTPPAGALRHLPPLDPRLDESAPAPARVLGEAVTCGSSAPDTSRRAHEPACTRPVVEAGAPPPRPALTPTVVALGRVADRCREDGLIPPLRGPRTVAGEILRLSRAELLEELPYRWWVGEVLDELRSAAHAIRAALDEIEPAVPLGRCPRKVLAPASLGVDGSFASRAVLRCAGIVRSRDGGHAAVCPGCGHRWVGERSVRSLVGALDDVELDAPACVAYLDGLGYGELRVGLIHKWASLDGWTRRRAGRRTVYRLGDVLASARRYRPSWPRTVAS